MGNRINLQDGKVNVLVHELDALSKSWKDVLRLELAMLTRCLVVMMFVIWVSIFR